MRTRIELWVAGAILSGVMVVGVFLLLPALQHSPDESEQSTVDVDSPVTETHDSSTDSSELDLINVVANSEDKSTDLMDVCSDPSSEELSQECWIAMDGYFLNWRFGWQNHVFEPGLSWLEFGQIFADPERDRKLVLATLEREECFLPYDEMEAFWGRNTADRIELCHPSSFLNYAQFNLICMQFRDGRDSERQWIDPDVAVYRGKTRFQHFLGAIEESEEGNNNPAQYERRKSWLWSEVLEIRWLKRQCESLSLRARSRRCS